MNSEIFNSGSVTQNAGTVIQAGIPPRKNRFLRLKALRYQTAGTLHTITLMSTLGTTTTTAQAAASQKNIVVAADPGAATSDPVSANDVLSWVKADGTLYFDTVNAVTGLTITMTNNLTEILASGATVYFHGIAGDHTGQKQLKAQANTLAVFEGPEGVWGDTVVNQSLVINADNGTNAGVLLHASGVYSTKP
jgi:hypothetical protein